MLDWYWRKILIERGYGARPDWKNIIHACISRMVTRDQHRQLKLGD